MEFLLVVVILMFGSGLLYKNRVIIARWLNDASLAVTDERRITILRRRIEDDTEEIATLEARLHKPE